MTVERLPRPDRWRVALDYQIEERGGTLFLGGPVAILMVGGHAGGVRLPLEILPILQDVDLESVDAIFTFARSVGVLGAWRDDFRMMDFTAAVVGTAGTGRRLPFRDPRTVRDRTGIDVERLIHTREKHAQSFDDRDGEFVDEFRLGAGGLLGLLAMRLEIERTTFSSRRLAREWPRYCPWEPPVSRGEAWDRLVGLVNGGLSSASLGLSWVRDEEIAAGVGRSFRPGPPVAATIATPETLYGVCVLELADHILADHEYRICANETCGRMFSVQEGRSRFGGHRTDTVKYHTVACKDAQAARDYRRRQATKKRGTTT